MRIAGQYSELRASSFELRASSFELRASSFEGVAIALVERQRLGLDSSCVTMKNLDAHLNNERHNGCHIER
jgi:hypothetical protein